MNFDIDVLAKWIDDLRTVTWMSRTVDGRYIGYISGILGTEEILFIAGGKFEARCCLDEVNNIIRAHQRLTK